MIVRRSLFAIGFVLATAIAGCTKNSPGVPRDARLVAEAPTMPGVFHAPADGMMFIVDRHPTGDRPDFLLYSGPIKRGQIVLIDPGTEPEIDQRATVDGKPIGLKLPTGDVWYRVYFQERAVD